MAQGLTPQQKAFYDQNGYIHVPSVITPTEAAHYRQEIHDLASRLRDLGAGIDATWSSVRQKDPAKQTVIHHCHNVQFHSAALARLITDPRMTSLAQGIIGPNVQLHHTKMFIKPPEKGSPFPMHQDYPYFPHQRDSMIAAIFYFDDCPIEKGCFRVIPGTHKFGPLPYEGDDHHLPADGYRIDDALPLPGKAGDVILFSYLLVHGSGINVSSEARTTLLVQMRDPTDPPMLNVHLSRGQGMMLAGIDPSCCTTQPLDAKPQPAMAM
jgi:ectoine hydroxylase-related dioxygenase (phytanoyl-CoA dioxygenase family)